MICLKRMNIREFYEKFGSGFKFLYFLENQPKDSKLRRNGCIANDKRVFDDMIIAQNPDCVQFGNALNERFAVDCIDYFDVRESCGDYFIDIVCQKIYNETVTFLCIKK